MKLYLSFKKELAIGIVFGFVCLCILPATALKNENPIQDEFRVTPEIHLMKRHLTPLTKAISLMNNTFYKPLLEHIKRALEQKGSVDAKDLRMIANELSISNISFYCGYMTTRGETGFASVFPFTLFALILYSLLHLYIGPMMVGMWVTDWKSSDHSWDGVGFSINGREVFEGATSGIALGGFGGVL